MADKCPVCNTDIPEIQRANVSLEECSCQRCGNFYLKMPLLTTLPRILQNDNQKIAVLSHWIRTKHEANVSDERGRIEMIILDRELIDSIIERPLPTPAEQADNFVRWLGNSIESSGQYGQYIELYNPEILAIIGTIDEAGFDFVFNHLREEGIIKIQTVTGGEIIGVKAKATLSFKGWERHKELKRGDVDSRKAFMAMKYNDEPLNKIVDEVFKPAVKQTGFDLTRLDDRPKAGLIDDRLRVEIQTSLFLIADLTHDNLGAYWEAGYAEGLGKPVIYTCEKSKFEKDPPHFDTNHHLTIPWDNSKREEAAAKLKATIRATLPEAAKLTDD